MNKNQALCEQARSTGGERDRHRPTAMGVFLSKPSVTKVRSDGSKEHRRDEMEGGVYLLPTFLAFLAFTRTAIFKMRTRSFETGPRRAAAPRSAFPAPIFLASCGHAAAHPSLGLDSLLRRIGVGWFAYHTQPLAHSIRLCWKEQEFMYIFWRHPAVVEYKFG